MTNTILLAVDDSTHSQRAADVAEKLARAHQGQSDRHPRP